MAKKKKKKSGTAGARIMSAIFGRALLPIVLILAIFFGAYSYSEPFRDFVDSLGILPTETTPSTNAGIPVIDPEGNELALHYIDVGQGDSTLLQSSAGAILIDCGETEYGETVVNYLREQGVEKLDYFIITHPDSDHMGCAAYILRNIAVEHFVINGKTKTAKFFSNALDAAEEAGVECEIAEAGDCFILGALRLDILGPYTDDIDSMDSNESSLIIRASWGKRVFLFTGDAEKKGEGLLLENNSAEMLRCDVFSAGHHGSKTSNSEALVSVILPRYVVISCGADNKYGHPNSEALDIFASHGCEVIRTDVSGTVIFITDGESLTYSVEK